ncbi:MAG: 4-hydroxyphenylpyruvate dioxygenase [Synechococcaceae cyanobacterium RM1_1_27]|nr:4-hydroxyphenylpyruvate dioxygenase [Synechococcaceae cyanobacterium SM2_3_2]NJO85587.1 4-hydroxyphenylpyruvate dioxygenase [Synechococcaceae cyanobacterium RM1_1_27]
MLECIEIDHVEFFVEDAGHWRQHFCQLWGLQDYGIRRQADTLSYWLGQGSVHVVVSQALRVTSPVASFLDQYAEGVADVVVRIRNGQSAVQHLTQLGIPWQWADPSRFGPQALHISIPGAPGGVGHTLLPRPQSLAQWVKAGIPIGPDFEWIAPAERLSFTTADPRWSHLDHVVLNGPVGSLVELQTWYERVMNWQVLYRYRIGTPQSGLDSVVMGTENGSIQLALNEPIGADSQIQDFLVANRGTGIQHIALATPDILSTIQTLVRRGIPFLPAPPQQSVDPVGQALTALGILVDRPDPSHPEQQVLQIFTQPLFGDPTFFFEIIQRVQNAQGFGETNFQSLFEAMETQQRLRQKPDNQ